MKFTEEQYQEIVEAWEGEYSYPNAMKSVIEKINGYAPLLPDFNTMNKAIAIANPLTREWAHEQYVEKEKRYVWTSKKPCYKDLYKRLFMSSVGYVTDFVITADEKLKVSEDEYLTETEVRNYGYDPEWFDKEEVE